ncbi:MAG: glycosyltransferase family 1 protein [Mesorhizobium amorphae]|nr:MAG: glycosyltransferase family 1 protein [Mesorhizobium amorphae]
MHKLPSPDPRPRLAFVATEDWFFASHFLPMLRAAHDAGFEPLVIARVRHHASVIEAAGGRVIPLEAERRSLNPLAALSATLRLARILRRERVSLVHCIALRAILVGGAAARLAGIGPRVYAVTGGGYLSAHAGRKARFAASRVRQALRGLLASPQTHYLFENRDDPTSFGLDPDAANVSVIGGAGVDPEHFAALPQAPHPPLRIALVARMLWSKGVDTAVEAVSLARAQGADVELSLFGEPDPSNPRAIGRELLEAWSQKPGIRWHGLSRDVRAVWRDHHLCCLPSRGGEGLPRTLLEAAACGRGLLTTDVPGCRSFVRDGRDGFVVPADDAQALAHHMVALAGDPALVAAMGESARARVLEGYTEAHVRERVAAIYRALVKTERL